MKKATLYFFMLLFAAQAAAASTLVSGEWMYSGESVAVESVSLLMVMSRTEVAADYGTGFFTVTNNSCRYSEYFYVCVDNIEYSHQTDKIRAYVKLYKRVPKLKITRTFSGESLRINENSTVSVSIENTGDVIAKNVAFIDSFPKELVVSDAEGNARIYGSTVTWSGEIKAGNTVELVYKIKPVDEIDASLKAEATYFTGFTTETVYSDAKRIAATPFFSITPILSRTDFSVGERVNFSVNLSNRDFYEVKINYLDVTLDSGLELLDAPSPFVKVGDNTYRWTGRISGAGSINTSNGTTYTRYNVTSAQLKYVLKAKRAPSANIYFSAKYTDSLGVAREIGQQKQSLTVSNKGVKVKSNMEDISVESFQKLKMAVWLQNINTYAAIKNVRVNISSFTYSPNLFFSSVPAAEHKTIVEKITYAPEVKVSAGEKILVNVSYQTEYGDNYTYSYITTFTVLPIKEPIITKTLTKTSLESGETTTVKVEVKNQRKAKISGVAVQEELPAGLVVSGATYRKADINAEDTLTAYAYTITAPKVNGTTLYSLKTVVSYISENITEYSSSQTNYTYSKEEFITVKPRQLTLTVEKQIADAKVYSGEIVDVNYKVSNPTTDQTAKNIAILFPLQQEFDLVGARQSFLIEDLGPGETAYINGKEKIRAKYNRSDLQLEKTRVEYLNSDGAFFHVNTTKVSLNVEGAYKKGPYVVVYKSAPASAGNVDAFVVNITLSNIGSDEAFVNLTDSTNLWQATVLPNTNRSFNYSSKITSAGVFELPQAVASYSYKDSSFTTGSNKPSIEITSKPLLSVEKSAPDKVELFDDFVVSVKVKSLLEKTLYNITITDSGSSWHIGNLSEEQSLNYSTSLSQPGDTMLGKAKVTYWFDGEGYSAESDDKNVFVSEEKALQLEKNVSKRDINQSEKFSVSIKVMNSKDEKISNINVTDEGQHWNIDLDAGQEKVLSYKTSLAEVRRYALPEASATYLYKDRQQVSKSNSVTVEVHESQTEAEEKAEEKAPEGIPAKILYYIKKVLTWRR